MGSDPFPQMEGSEAAKQVLKVITTSGQTLTLTLTPTLTLTLTPTLALANTSTNSNSNSNTKSLLFCDRETLDLEIFRKFSPVLSRETFKLRNFQEILKILSPLY